LLCDVTQTASASASANSLAQVRDSDPNVCGNVSVEFTTVWERSLIAEEKFNTFVELFLVGGMSSVGSIERSGSFKVTVIHQLFETSESKT